MCTIKKGRKFLGGCLIALMFLLGISLPIDAQVKGAVFTTNDVGSFVNANVYEFKEDVYLNGGPRPNAPCTAAGLPDGDYVFQVTDPSGKILLSSDPIEARMVGISGGVISSNLGTHTISPQVGQCNSITIQLAPFLPTPNPGGEYKVWMTPVDYYNTFGFLPRYSKTDNFKVLNDAQSEGDGDGDDSCSECQ